MSGDRLAIYTPERPADPPPNDFHVSGDPGPRPRTDPVELLTDEQREQIKLEAASWGSGLQASVAAAGFASPADYLAAHDLSAIETLADYLAAVERFMVRYVAFPSEHEAVAIALWVAHAHLADQFETSPLLAVTSAEMRSGKTRTLDALELLVPQPFRVVTPSEAVVYTILSRRPRPTMLLDEADAIFGPRRSRCG